jgi:hypothetical protein
MSPNKGRWCVLLSPRRLFYRFGFFWDDVVDAEWEWVSSRIKDNGESFWTNYGYVMIDKYKFLSIPRGM